MELDPNDASRPRAALPVSVIIPNYNSADWLLECVASINDSDPPSEIIIVDDGSTDRSPDVARSIVDRSTNVRLLMRDVNGGIVAARQDGLSAASEAHVTFVDADDYLERGAIRSAYEALLRTGADLCIWQLWRTLAGREWLFIPLEGISFPISGDAAMRLTLGVWNIHPLGVARRMVWVDAYADFSETYPNADELVTRLAFLNARTVTCCDKKYYYRLHDESHSQKMHPRRLGILNSQLWLLRFGRRVGVDREEAVVRFSARECLLLWKNRRLLGAADTHANLQSFLRELSKEVSYPALLRRCPKHVLALVGMRVWLAFARRWNPS